MKTLNNYFSKIYCINLDRRPDRWEQCMIEFNEINVDVERISAIDGKNFPKSRMGIKPGAHGLVLTNIKILEDAISNRYESILIFEDDVKFVADFNRIFNEKINNLPSDWNLLYLGGIHKIKPKNNEYDIYKTSSTITTHAVGINSNFFQTLLESIKKNMTSPIDKIQQRLQQNNNAYTFVPSIAMQRASYSDIENRFRH